jgi:hypothetical protein
VAMKNTVFWDIKTQFVPHSVRRLLVIESVVTTSPILVTLMMEALSSSETSVFTRATWRNNPRRRNFSKFAACKPSALWGSCSGLEAVCQLEIAVWV